MQSYFLQVLYFYIIFNKKILYLFNIILSNIFLYNINIIIIFLKLCWIYEIEIMFERIYKDRWEDEKNWISETTLLWWMLHIFEIMQYMK